MSDSESAPSVPHPSLGGKTLQSIERPRYKSWRKKYRKIRHHFDAVLEENKRMYKEEYKLEATAKRLREELDELLDLCFELNAAPAVPPELRFDVSYPSQYHYQLVVPKDITPEAANKMHTEYNEAVRSGTIPQLDLHVVRQQIDEHLAARGTTSLESLEKSVQHAVGGEIPEDLKLEEPPGFLTPEQEIEYLARLDAKLEPKKVGLTTSEKKENSEERDDRHWAEMTPREFERHMEMLNPHSQHNWLKTHAKRDVLDKWDGMDDNDSLASHDIGGASTAKPAPSRKKAEKGKTLAKQVGDRAVERAREGWSPSAASAMEEDDLGTFPVDDAITLVGKKKKDPDATYRVKGGKSGGSGKGKRKRSGEDVWGLDPSIGGGSSAGGKKAKIDGD